MENGMSLSYFIQRQLPIPSTAKLNGATMEL